MVVDLTTLDALQYSEEEEDPIPEPSIVADVDEDEYGKFVIEPLEPGYGVTLGNPMRRILYNGLEGSAVTSVRIEGVQHEYQAIPNIREQVTEILLNVKAIRLRSEVDIPGKLRLEVAGEGQVCAADIMASADFEVVNPELHIATLDSPDAKISLELNVERGKGYREATEDEAPIIGVLPIDAIFTPMRKVNYRVEPMRVGQRTNYERLILEVWTDGSITPVEAVKKASTILVDQFYMFANTEKAAMGVVQDGTPITVTIPPEHYNAPIERLHLGSRTLNSIKRAGIDKVGQVLEMSREDMLKIKSFGEKSYDELIDKLTENAYLQPGMHHFPDPAAQELEAETEAENDDPPSGIHTPTDQAEPESEAKP